MGVDKISGDEEEKGRNRDAKPDGHLLCPEMADVLHDFLTNHNNNKNLS